MTLEHQTLDTDEASDSEDSHDAIADDKDVKEAFTRKKETSSRQERTDVASMNNFTKKTPSPEEDIFKVLNMKIVRTTRTRNEETSK